MAFLPNYDEVGKGFVQQYYATFDNADLRQNLGNFYTENKSLMTFEGQQMIGKRLIMEKLQSLTFRTIQHVVTTVDTQPTFDGGVVVSVLGQLKTDEDPPHTYNQVFILKQENSSFYVEHDIFRLGLHI